MKGPGKPDAVAEELSDATVLDLLRANPDFFVRHPDVLDSLRIPHDSGAAISLIEYQVERLRGKNLELQNQLQSLIQIARQNEDLSKRLHRLALALMEADSLVDVLSTAVDVLRDEFPTTKAIIRLFPQRLTDNQAVTHLFDDSTDLSALDELFKNNQPVSGVIDNIRKKLAFDGQHKDIASAVLIPLADTEKLGLLAMGSHEADRFRSGVGTLFPAALGEMLSQAIRIRL